jgi:mercuric ion transport protein
MRDQTILRTGIVGSIVAAVCCATPVLTIVLGAFGLSAWLAWADYVALSALIAFVALTGYALYRMRLHRMRLHRMRLRGG